MKLYTILLDAAAPKQGMDWTFLAMMGGIFVIMYFLMIRPQQKRQKELVNFRNSLNKGDKVMTAGGIYGTIKEIKETSVLLEVDSNVTLRVDKAMITRDNSAAQQGK